MTINEFNFAGKKAIVRVDFNVPLDENGKITDDTRIRGALPTLKKILADGGATIIMSHMGKPKGKVNPKLSLGQIREAVEKALGVPVAFAPDCAKAADAAKALKMGEALLLENLRYYPEEEGKPVGVEKGTPEYDEAKKAMKASQKEFAKTLASYADCYVMDAFGTAHRKHASTAVIADYFDADNKMLGLLMEKEVQAVDNVLSNIKRPFVAIMGGSKVSSKIGIIENLLGKVDKLILCGGMTYTFAKAHNGEIGDSIVELDKLDVALGVEELAKKNGVELVLGSDCTATNGLDFGTMTVKEGAEIILDQCAEIQGPVPDLQMQSREGFFNCVCFLLAWLFYMNPFRAVCRHEEDGSDLVQETQAEFDTIVVHFKQSQGESGDSCTADWVISPVCVSEK